MVLRLTWGKLHPGQWDEFERPYRAMVVAQVKDVKGLRGRWLAQDTAEKDPGFAVRLWDSAAALQTYDQRALYPEVVAPLQLFCRRRVPNVSM